MDAERTVRARRPGRRWICGPLAAVLLTTLTALGTTSVAGAVAPAAAADSASAAVSSYQGSPAMARSTYERRVQFWINRRRHQHGLHRLKYASCTDRVAERWGKHLALNDAFRHQSMMRILLKCDAYYAGETLGRGAITPRRLVYLWMHSPEHREVLLSSHAHRIGIGCYPDRYGRWVTAVDFMQF